MQGRASVTFVELLHEFLRQRGLDSEQVLGEARQEVDLAATEFITVRHWATLLGRADRALRQPAMGLALGASIGTSHLGVVGYLARSCATLGQALHRSSDYLRLLYETDPCRMRFELTGLVLEWGVARGRPGQLADECALAMLTAYGRELTGVPDGAPSEIRFVNPPPPSLQPYLDFFRCPVSFDAPTTVMKLSYATLARRIPRPEPTLLALMELQARERLNRLPPSDPFLASLRDAMAQLMPEGRATLAACASRLHCSSRTLQRRLLAQNLNFQTLLDEVRLQLAESYLADGQLKLAEVALLLGFADQTTFTHAFTRWTGLPPARWRARRPGHGEPAPVQAGGPPAGLAGCGRPQTLAGKVSPPETAG